MKPTESLSPTLNSYRHLFNAFEVNSKTPDLLVIDFVVSVLFEFFAFNSIIELFVFFIMSFALSDVEEPIIILPLTSKLPVALFVLT